MYKIRGADQKEYGPVTVDTIRQWIAQRRVDARTPIQAEGSTEWRPAGAFAEFKDALAAQVPNPTAAPPLPRSVPGPTKAPPAGRPAKTSGMAVASLVLGIFGCLGVTGILGLVLGVSALIRITRSGGRLKGTGQAVAGIVLSGIMLLAGLPILAGLLVPALAKAKDKARYASMENQCAGNLKQLVIAVRLYANANNDQYPPGASWCDTIAVEVAEPDLFRCPQRRGQRSAYAFNQRLVGKKETEVDPSTVLLFEFDGGWNITGGPELLPNRMPHGQTINIALADGSVRPVQPSDFSTLRWDP
jgi:prepilin-type processing-associated H-X9-DG protein